MYLPRYFLGEYLDPFLKKYLYLDTFLKYLEQVCPSGWRD